MPKRTDDLSRYSLGVVLLDDTPAILSHHKSLRGLVDPTLLQEYKKFVTHPAEFPCFFYLENVDGDVCSYFRIIPDEVSLNGEVYPWAWTGDNYTVPELRGRGLSTYLQQFATHSLHDMGIGRGSVSSTDVTLRIFRKLDFHIAGYAKRHILVQSPDPILRAYVHHDRVLRSTLAIARPCTRMGMKFLRAWNSSKRKGTSCERITDSLNPEFQALVKRTVGQRSIHFKSDSHLLGTKIMLSQRNSDVAVYLVRDAEGQTIASMVLREQFQTELLAERYCGFRRITLLHHAIANNDSTAASALVGHLVEIFSQSGADVLDLVSNDDVLNCAASHCGFICVGKGMSFAYSVPRAWQWPTMAEEFCNWPITCMCGDAYTF